MICSANERGSRKKDNLSQAEKEQIIKRLRNYPFLPQIKQVVGKRQSQILCDLYPWGCSKLTQNAQFTDYDRIYEIWFPDHSNICMSIKYGICPFFRLKNLKFIHQQWIKHKQRNNDGHIYLKFVDNQKIYAIVRLVDLRLDVNFKFWYVVNGMEYPTGLGFIQVISVGQIRRDLYNDNLKTNLRILCQQLKDNELSWIKFKGSDEYEWIQRTKYILAVKNDRCSSLEKKLENRTQDVIKEIEK